MFSICPDTGVCCHPGRETFRSVCVCACVHVRACVCVVVYVRAHVDGLEGQTPCSFPVRPSCWFRVLSLPSRAQPTFSSPLSSA